MNKYIVSHVSYSAHTASIAFLHAVHICHQKQQRPKQTYEEVDIDNDSDGNTKKYYSLDVTPEHLNENDSSLEPAPEVPPRKPIQPSETPTIHVNETLPT